jgi:hypothetical protein
VPNIRIRVLGEYVKKLIKIMNGIIKINVNVTSKILIDDESRQVS